MIHLQTPLKDSDIENLKVGDIVNITGHIFTARDAAHKRLVEMIEKGQELPFDVKNQIVYYAGPSPNRPGTVVGSIGPTTSGRMDAYSVTMINQGLKFMIGKGVRRQPVKDAIVENKGVYFAAIGGAAALIAQSVKAVELIAFEDLGTEAIRKITVEDFPAIVAVDSKGNDIYNR